MRAVVMGASLAFAIHTMGDPEAHMEKAMGKAFMLTVATPKHAGAPVASADGAPILNFPIGNRDKSIAHLRRQIVKSEETVDRMKAVLERVRSREATMDGSQAKTTPVNARSLTNTIFGFWYFGYGIGLTLFLSIIYKFFIKGNGSAPALGMNPVNGANVQSSAVISLPLMPFGAGPRTAEGKRSGDVTMLMSSSGRGDATRREVVLQAAAAATIGFAPPQAFAEDAPAADKSKSLSRDQINAKLLKVPVIALVNAENSPFLTDENGRVGYFYLDPTDALIALKVLQKKSPDVKLKIVTLSDVYFPLVRREQPGFRDDLRLRPTRRQCVLANKFLAIYTGDPTNPFNLPKTLDETKGEVPIFFSQTMMYEIEGTQAYPFFFSRDDLDAALDELLRKTGGKRGTVEITTLDKLVDSMLSGDVDLTQAIVVPAQSSVEAMQPLFKDGA